jgi:nitrite reductase (NO-forming)
MATTPGSDETTGETRSVGTAAMLAGVAVALILSAAALIAAASGLPGREAAAPVTADAAADLPTELAVELDEMTITPGDLELAVGGTLQVMNTGAAGHDLVIEGSQSAVPILEPGEEHRLALDDVGPGVHTVYCTVPGHREAGMEATLLVGQVDEVATSASARSVSDGGDGTVDVLPTLVAKSELPPVPEDERNVGVAPEMPPAATRTDQAIVEVAFEVVENVSTIDPAKGTQHETWGYRIADGPDTLVVGTPGPVIRARVGDVLRFTITNPEGNQHPHNVDFHAVTGQGGGAEATTVAPGETRTIEARLLYPGFFMYHCAYGDVPSHISHGMFGGILVDPEDPLPEADHEWYMVQSEYYLDDSDDEVRALDRAAITDEAPSHVVFNGAVGALTGDGALQMAVGERGRIYFVNAGLNLDSNFHPIGSHWDVVYQEAALLNAPLRGSQTTLVAAGGGTVVELVAYVPQTIVLVDHALARAFDKGAIGLIEVSGEEDPEIFEEVEAAAADVATAAEADDDTVDEAEDETSAEVGNGTGHDVAILAGSGEFHDLDVPWEFDDDEVPGDYSVNVLQIEVGDTVTWINEDDAMLHTATAVDGSFDSGLLRTGESWSHTFTEAGEFEYLCTPHPWMRAKVIVSP